MGSWFGFAQIIDERNIDTENIADYIMRAFDGFVDLVEIKKPNGLQFWSATKDHNNYVPSTDLVKAITQCLNYIYAIEREANSVKFIEKTKSKVIKPRCILILDVLMIGMTNSEKLTEYSMLHTIKYQFLHMIIFYSVQKCIRDNGRY